MIKFKLFLLTLSLSLLVILTACSSASKKEVQELEICPQCNMELPKSHIHTSTMSDNGNIHYFDDIGCMILWAKDNDFNFTTIKSKVFTNDTHRYIDSNRAFYTINEKTPMFYGFSAYENSKDGVINFDEVIMRMLRGEHMANPRIRKQILGY
ncbi:MAG: hypothetical protein U9N33_09810 [Campylobacterota bacterium]|nr:hypothetical protein [Campylobacterota bacterium]